MSSDIIQIACRQSDFQSLISLISANPLYLNQQDPKLGWAPLYRASILENLELAKLLLSLGADPNVRNRLGEAPLHQSCEKNSVDLTRLLLSYNANVNIQQNDGDTPLHLACTKNHSEIVKILLEKNANPDVPNSVLGRVPLHIACEKNYLGIVELLLKNNAKVLIEDKNNQKPGDLTSDPEIMALLDRYEEGEHVKNMETEEDSPSKDSNHEPESEKGIIGGSLRRSVQSFSFGEASKSALHVWLMYHHLEEIHEILLANGFDDLDLLIEAMQGNPPLNDEVLKNIGVCKVGHRLRLLCSLEEENLPSFSSRNSELKFNWCVAPLENKTHFKTTCIDEWLKTLSLGFLSVKFEEQGFDDFEQISKLMNSNFPITDKVLEEIGVEKLGHRHRILSKLNLEKKSIKRENLMKIEKNGQVIACEMCLVM